MDPFSFAFMGLWDLDGETPQQRLSGALKAATATVQRGSPVAEPYRRRGDVQRVGGAVAVGVAFAARGPVASTEASAEAARCIAPPVGGQVFEQCAVLLGPIRSVGANALERCVAGGRIHELSSLTR